MERRQNGPRAPLKGTDRPPLLGRYLTLATADLAARGLGFVAASLVVRRFGAAAFGRLSLALALLPYALLAGTGGTDIYAIRSAARTPQAVPALVGPVVGLRLVLGLVAYTILVGLACWLPSLRAATDLVAVYGLSLLPAALSLAWVPEALQKAHVLAAASLATAVLSLLLLGTALALHQQLWAVPTSQVATEGLVALGLFAWVRRRWGRLSGQEELQIAICNLQWSSRKPRLAQGLRDAAGILRQSAPIAGARALRAVAMGSDLLILSWFVPLRALGWYGGAYRLFLLGVSLTAGYFTVLFPRLARQASGPPRALEREITASLRRVLPVVLVVIGPGILFAEDLLQTLYDASFGAAARSLQLLLLAVIACLVGGHYRNSLLAANRQRLDLALVAIASLVHVVFKVALVPALGIEGAALGTLLGEFSLVLLGVGFTRRRHTAPAAAELVRVPQEVPA